MPSQRSNRRRGRCSHFWPHRRREKRRDWTRLRPDGCDEEMNSARHDATGRRVHRCMDKPMIRAVPTEVQMRTTKWLLAAGLVAATAACTTDGAITPTRRTIVGTTAAYYAPSSSYNRSYYSSSPGLLLAELLLQQQLLHRQPHPAARPQRRLRPRWHPEQVRPRCQRRRRSRPLPALKLNGRHPA